MSNPTQISYTELQTAYDLFNKQLFDGALPDCLLTLQPRDKRIAGFFSSKRFEDIQGQHTDELAMNPTYFHSKPIEFALQTLGHEMAHVWQFHHGRPGRRGYHNKELAMKMKTIGLYPSSTGLPGGKETGEHMSDYLIPDGPIAGLIDGLIAKGFRLTWAERPYSPPAGEYNGEDETEGEGQGGTTKPNRTNRVKFTCPKCDANAWGKPTLSLLCGVCKVAFVGEDE